jgi:hypothetical protein
MRLTIASHFFAWSTLACFFLLFVRLGSNLRHTQLPESSVSDVTHKLRVSAMAVVASTRIFLRHGNVLVPVLRYITSAVGPADSSCRQLILCCSSRFLCFFVTTAVVVASLDTPKLCMVGARTGYPPYSCRVHGLALTLIVIKV